jgi:hypothetical protein
MRLGDINMVDEHGVPLVDPYTKGRLVAQRLSCPPVEYTPHFVDDRRVYCRESVEIDVFGHENVVVCVASIDNSIVSDRILHSLLCPIHQHVLHPISKVEFQVAGSARYSRNFRNMVNVFIVEGCPNSPMLGFGCVFESIKGSVVSRQTMMFVLLFAVSSDAAPLV